MVPVRSTGASAYCQKRHAPMPPAAAWEPYICTCSIMLLAVGMAPSTRNTSQNAGLEGTADAESVARSARNMQTFSRGIAARRTVAMDNAVCLSHREWSGPLASEAPEGKGLPRVSPKSRAKPSLQTLVELCHNDGVNSSTLYWYKRADLLYTVGLFWKKCKKKKKSWRGAGRVMVIEVVIEGYSCSDARGSSGERGQYTQFNTTQHNAARVQTFQPGALPRALRLSSHLG